MAKTYKLIADEINGIMLDDSFDGYEGLEMVDEEYFLYSISSLGDEDEVVGAEVSEETYLKLKEEYGVTDRRTHKED